MEFTYQPHLDKRKQADLLVVPFWKKEKTVRCAADCKELDGVIAAPLSTEDFTGKEGKSSSCM